MKLKLIIIHVKTIFAYKTYLSVKYRDKQIQKLSFSNTYYILEDYEIRAIYLEMQNCALKASLKKQSHNFTQQLGELFLSFFG